MIWLSAQDIADAAQAGLMPGLPTGERAVRRFAARAGWADSGLARMREGRSGGGGLEYHVDLLPAAARLRWLGSQMRIDAADLRPELRDGPVNSAADARQVLVHLAARLCDQAALAQSSADQMFCDMFAAGCIDLPDWIRDEVSSISPRTLARWRSQGAKPTRVGRPKGSGILDRAEGGAVRALILAALAKQSFLKAKHLHALVEDRYGETLELVCDETGEVRTVPLPSVRTFQIAVKAWRSEYRNELMRVTDPDGYRSKIEFSATGSQRADRLNQIWQIDASPADIMLKGGRHSIYMAVDVYSRRSIVLATPTPRAAGVGLLIRKCLLDWGVPEVIHTDNGSDFVARQTQRLLAALGIEVELSPPYNPKSKGIVERTIGTFQRDLATCPGFIGHSVADRKVIENRRAFNQRLGATDDQLFGVEMDLPEFQSWCDDWGAKIYGHDTHSSLGGRTPFAVAASYAGPVRRIEDASTLDVLLAPIASGGGLRRVSKQGVRVDGARYLPLGVMPGTDVLVRMDPADAGSVMLFDTEGETFLGEAICPELAGLAPAEIVAQAKAIQKAHETERLSDIRRTMRGLKPRDIADALRRDGEKRANVVTAFPERPESYNTAALDAAGEASGTRAIPAPERRAVDDDAYAGFVADFAAHQKPKPKAPEMDARERFQKALRLEAALEAGAPVDEADAAWLRVYQGQPQYAAQRMIYEEFGQAMFA